MAQFFKLAVCLAALFSRRKILTISIQELRQVAQGACISLLWKRAFLPNVLKYTGLTPLPG